MKDYELECARLELELEDEKAAKEKLEAENQKLRDEAIDYRTTIAESGEKVLQLSGELENKKSKIASLEERIEEMEEDSNTSQEGDEVYRICGEDVTIISDDIAYQSFFELFAERTRKFSINELTTFIEKIQ